MKTENEKWCLLIEEGNSDYEISNYGRIKKIKKSVYFKEWNKQF